MAKGPDRPRAPHRRDPAKHSKKNPANPPRAKAARPDMPVLDPSLADLLNPGIGQGRAGIGAQTGITSSKLQRSDPSPLVGEGASTPTPNPSPQEGREHKARSPRENRSGLQP